MIKILLIFKGILLLFFFVSIYFSICEISGSSAFLKKFNYEDPIYDGKEEFNPSLRYLDNFSLLAAHCDSLYETLSHKNTSDFPSSYVNIVDRTIRKKFYHGYSTFGFGNNYIALLGEVFYKKGISSIVLSDEMLGHSFAACSQQSILVMEVLKKKGFVTRKVGFPPVDGAGHFCVEVFYNNSWHFIDTNMEPDLAVLEAYRYPDAKFLATHKDIVAKAYGNHNPERAIRLFSGNIFYDTPNKFPAQNGRIYQNFSKVLSYTLWLLIGILYFIVHKKYNSLRQKHVRNNRIYFPSFKRSQPSAYNADYQA